MNKKMFTVILDEGTIGRLETFAEENGGLSRSAALRLIIAEKVRSQHDQKQS